jgi:hypothetical protein
VIVDSVAAEFAARRLLHAQGSIGEAFESLDLGWTLEDVHEYMKGSPTFLAIPEDLQAQVVGMTMAFGIVVAERSREGVRR